MPQKPVEVILLRQLVDYLMQPVFILDPNENLIFCNNSAGKMIGFNFSETGEIPADEWATIFIPQNEDGAPIQKEKLPFYISTTTLRNAYDKFFVRNLQNQIKYIEVFTFPIINHIQNFLGTVVFFQDIKL